MGPTFAGPTQGSTMAEARKLERAIVLAAGMGSRLVSGEKYPKPLKPISGVPLLVRILRTLQDEGIREAVIVTGHLGAELRAALLAEPTLVLSLTFVENEHYGLKNGVSLLAAREFLDRECLLTMADHLVAPALLRRLVRAEIPAGACALGVDFDIERCFDLDDATKVLVEGGRIGAISKELDAFNAIDTGIFRVNSALADALDEVFLRGGDASLSDGVRALAATGRFVAVDVGDARWIDVDTPEAQARAEAMLRVFGDGLDDADGDHVPRAPHRARGHGDVRALLGARRLALPGRPLRPRRPGLPQRQRRVRRLMSNESPFAPFEAGHRGGGEGPLPRAPLPQRLDGANSAPASQAPRASTPRAACSARARARSSTCWCAPSWRPAKRS
jgi:1L-myo-inositol 1-phosphate cytidylyltransferase